LIKLYDKNETDFTTNGIKVLQPISAIVNEEINGNYALEIVMSKWDTSIETESIIKAPTPKGEQLFRVFMPDVNALSSNTYFARHIFYDLLDSFIEDKRPNGSAQEALNSILQGTFFSGISLITYNNTATYQMMSPVKALLGAENSIINRWGGEIERDNFTISLKSSLGIDRGVSIRFRKNLTGLNVKTEISNIVTRIYPTGRQADGQTLLTLPEKYVDSPLLANYANPKITRIDYSEARTEQELRVLAQTEFSENNLDKPLISASVNFIPLESTEEYKDLAVLERVYLGDTVHIFHEPLSIELTAKVVSYSYNCLTKKYINVTLGNVIAPFGSEKSIVAKMAYKASQEAADNATALITSAMGGYVVKRENELLIMDTDNPMTAQKIWRWNLNGLGYSSTGINGPYGLAMTIDGHIVADFIDVGMLKGIILQSANYIANSAGTKIDLANGTIDSKNFKVSSDGTVNATNGVFDGTINVNAGQIGGFAINEYDLGSSTSTTDPATGIKTTNDINISSSFGLSTAQKIEGDGMNYVYVTLNSGGIIFGFAHEGAGQYYSTVSMQAGYNVIEVDGNFRVNGSIYSNGVQVTSDRGKKTEIKQQNLYALDEIGKPNFYSYRMKDEDNYNCKFGLMYDEAPNCIKQENAKGEKHIDLYAYNSLNLKAIQELSKKLDRLANRVDDLEIENARLKKDLKREKKVNEIKTKNLNKKVGEINGK